MNHTPRTPPLPPSPSPSPAASSTPRPERKLPTRVIKKLEPHAPGARRWAAAYGDKLVCVRYRVDALSQRRQTTVEIVVDEAPTQNSLRVGVRVAWGEKEIARAVRSAGGTWDPEARLWMMTLGQAKGLGLTDRIVVGEGG